MVVVVLPTPPFWFAIAIIRGVGYGPVGVVPGMFMMSQEYRRSAAFRGMAYQNVPRGTFPAWVGGPVVKVPRGTLQRGELGWAKPARASRIKRVLDIGGPRKTLYIGTHHRNLFLNA
jgi:hypothetical protein